MWCQSFWIWEKMGIFFFFYLFGNGLYVLIFMFMHSVLKSFRCNFRNKHCNWVTNRKSMKLDFAMLRIEEKTILQIKNLPTLFLFPDASLWFGVSMNGHQWVPLCGRGAGDCVGAWGSWRWVWGSAAELCSHPILQMVWFDWQVLSASQMVAPHPVHLTDPKYDVLRQRFKERRPGQLLPQFPCLFLLCSSGSRSCAVREGAHMALSIVPVGKWEELYFFSSAPCSIFETSV